MRKIVSIIAALCIVVTALFAVSYTNNTYHKLAEEYTEKAQKAMDAGYYELAEEYAAEAKKNAALSEEFIAMMLAKTEAEEAIKNAKARIETALEKGVDPNSKEYKDALASLNKAQSEFENEEYPEAKADAEKVGQILSDEYLASVAAENEAKNAAKDAIAKAKEALDAAEAAGIPTDSDEYKAAKDYYDQAQKDFDDGKYDSAKENAEKAVEALASDELKNALAKKDAEKELVKAKEALDKAEKAGLDDSYPAYKEAKQAYEQAQRDFADEKYPESIENSKKVQDLLSDENVDDMIAKAKDDAEKAVAKAKKALEDAEEAGADKNADPYKSALDAYNKAVEEFNNKEYKDAEKDAEKASGLLNDDYIEGLKNAKNEEDAAAAEKRAAAEEALAKAKEALDNAKESGLSPLNEDYREAVDLYASAKDAFDNGDYDKAKEDAEKVLELMDPDAVKKMKEKDDAEAAISKARERIIAANAAGLDTSFDPYKDALGHYREAQKAFADEDYVKAKEEADKVPELLTDEEINRMLDEVEAQKDKSAAEGALAAAKERIDYAESAGLDESDKKFKAALEYYNRALDEFAAENYPECTDDANMVLSLLDDSYINNLLARGEAEKAIAAAKDRIAYADSINAARDFPIAYEAAKAYYAQALDDYTAEQFEKAVADANKVIDALADIHEMAVLPKYYIVRPWAESKDCFWNISGRSYVYNNPWLWENLYEANKDNIPERNNPNLILPGMKMEIPSISGEYRDGVYSPDVEYGTFSTNR